VNDFHIVPLQEAHIAAIAALESAAFSRPWSADSLRAALQDPLSSFLAAEHNGTTVGYLGLYCVLDEGQITNIAVHPSFRRRGIATALLREAAAEGQRRGLCRLTLEVRVSNTAAIAVYENLGWQRDGIRPQFYDRPVEDAALYSLLLS